MRASRLRSRWLGVDVAAPLALLLAGPSGVSADPACSVPPLNLTGAPSEDGSSVVLGRETSPRCTPDGYEVYRRGMDVEGARMTHIAAVDGSTPAYTDG